MSANETENLEDGYGIARLEVRLAAARERIAQRVPFDPDEMNVRDFTAALIDYRSANERILILTRALEMALEDLEVEYGAEPDTLRCCEPDDLCHGHYTIRRAREVLAIVASNEEG